MGKVYLATDPKFKRQVALKLLPGSSFTNEKIKERFLREARTIAALKHPNIVQLYDHSSNDAPEPFLAMEYLNGTPLDLLVAQHGPLSEPTALCVAHELCLALTHAHGKHVIHRDIKPQNVMLQEGRVVLMDFGVMKAMADDSPLGAGAARSLTQALGTPGFMAPEQFIGK